MIKPKPHWICAYVLFRDEKKLKLLRILKKGFRHCAVILESENHWLYIDQTFFQTEMRVWPKELMPLDVFKREGWMILKTNPPPFQKENVFRFGWVDCVSVTKRIFGIKKWGIYTPHQLYQFLN
ncbi:MAG: hypothetical protein JW812_00205 [Alphaproteobacteria bacterium]|nr:hypothetical protein [Alphaproteobacteria bacterium]MBN2779726.1 hypothetical protein [Alphaproteobacteria bacterium]